MVFNGDANDLDLCTLADKMLGGTNDTEFPLSEKALYANMSLRDIFRAIYRVYGGWSFQDSNVTGQDRVSANLLNDGTQFYAFATVSWLIGMEWTDANGDDFPLTPITLEQMREMGYAEDEFMNTAGRPQYYRPVKNGVKIYPSSNVAVTNGLTALIGAQDINAFTAASTSTSPGYDSLAGHEAVAAGMAMYFADYNEMTAFGKRKDAFMEALNGVIAHYKKKFMEVKPNLKGGTGRRDYASEFIS